MAASTVQISNFMGTGINLVPLPTSPGFRSISFKLLQPTQANISPYTRTAQMVQFPGAEQWTASVSTPPLSLADAASWSATFESLRGTLHAFQLGNQAYSGPLNPSAVQGSSPVVTTNANTPNTTGTMTLGTRGWIPSQFGILMLGDYLQIGYRLYRVMATTDSDAGGNAVLTVAPSLREIPQDGTPIDVVSPVGIFRLAEEIDEPYDYTRLTRLSFRCIEVK